MIPLEYNYNNSNNKTNIDSNHKYRHATLGIIS